MRGPNRLREMAAARGVTVLELITEAIEQRGSMLGAAQELGVAPNAIKYQLKRAGMRVEIIGPPRARVVTE